MGELKLGGIMKALLQRALLIMVVAVALSATALFIMGRCPNVLDHWLFTTLAILGAAAPAVAARLVGSDDTAKR